tara:strand:+ start:9969 stop:10997 length:1029 start_codon:yes stop_codon:yes gene_type:complete
MRKVWVNASNLHSGGGKTLMLGFIKGIKHIGNAHFIIYHDSRFLLQKNFLKNNITYISIKSFFERVMISKKINSKYSEGDKIIYLGNLPPLINFTNCQSTLLLSNRFYVDSPRYVKKLDLKIRFKIFLEKLYFKLFIKNVDDIIVQTQTMKDLCVKSNIKSNIYILPFDDFDSIQPKKIKKIKNSFLYVASTLPYKNHLRLIKAFSILNNYTNEYTLFITLGSQDDKITSQIKKLIKKNKLNVVLLENITRTTLLSYFEKVENLIYPSLFEAYGLPLVEAKRYNMKIISADLDYAWDLIKPDDYFNPYSSVSIFKALTRTIGINIPTNKILNPKQFINKLLN